MCVCFLSPSLSLSLTLCVRIIDDGGGYLDQSIGLMISCFKKVMVVFFLSPPSVLESHSELFFVSIAQIRGLGFQLIHARQVGLVCGREVWCNAACCQ